MSFEDDSDLASAQPAHATGAVNGMTVKPTDGAAAVAAALSAFTAADYLPVDKYRDIPPQQAVAIGRDTTVVDYVADDAGLAPALASADRVIVTSANVKIPWDDADAGRKNAGKPTILASPPCSRPGFLFKHSFMFSPQVALFSNIKGTLGNYNPPKQWKEAMSNRNLDHTKYKQRNKDDLSLAEGDVTTTFSGYCPAKVVGQTVVDERCYDDLLKICHVEILIAWDLSVTWKCGPANKLLLGEWAASRIRKYKLDVHGKDPAVARAKAGAMMVLGSPRFKSCLKIPLDVTLDRTDNNAVAQWEEKIFSAIAACDTVEAVVEYVAQARLGPDGSGRGLGIRWTHRYFEGGAVVRYPVPPAHLADPNWGTVIAEATKYLLAYVPLVVHVGTSHKGGEMLSPSETKFDRGTLFIPFGNFQVYDNPTQKGAEYAAVRLVLDGARLLKKDVKTLDAGGGSGGANGAGSAASAAAVEDAIPGFEDEHYDLQVVRMVDDEDRAEIARQIATGALKKQEQALKALQTMHNKRQGAQAATLVYNRTVQPALPAPIPDRATEHKTTTSANGSGGGSSGVGGLADLDDEALAAMTLPGDKGPPPATAAPPSSPASSAPRNPVPRSPAVRPTVLKRKPEVDNETLHTKQQNSSGRRGQAAAAQSNGKAKETSTTKRQRKQEVVEDDD